MIAADVAAPTVSSRGSRRWPALAAAFFLFTTVGGFSIVDRLLYGEWSGKSGDKLTQILNLLQIAAALALFVRGCLDRRRLTAGAVLALSLVGFLCLTSLWSVEPGITLRRGILYGLFVLGAIGIADTLEADAFMAVLRGLCFMSAAISLVGVIVSPANVLSPGGGELRGIFVHKNVLGQIMAVGVVATLHGMRTSRRHLRGIAMLATYVLATLLARSGTTLMTIVVACTVDLLTTLLRRGGASRIMGMLLCAVALVVGLVFALAPELLLDALGKDPTLTGRTVLWQYVDFYIGQRPLLGWGFAAFWSQNNPLANGISDTLGWSVPEAHNAVRELLLEVGALGSLVFLALFLRNVVIALRCLTTAARELAISALLCHLAMIVVGMTEEVLVDHSQIYVGVFFVTGLMCDQALLSRRTAAPAGTAGEWRAVLQAESAY